MKSIVRQNLDPYVDGQAFTRIVMGLMQTVVHLLNVLQFEQNFRNTLIENYGSAFAKYSNRKLYHAPL